MRLRRIAFGAIATGLLAGVAGSGTAVGATVVLPPIKDNTLYESSTGSLSNGLGANLFAGRTSFFSGGLIRRGLLAFDVAGNIPAGSTVTSVTLQMSLSQTAFDTGPQPFSLHRVLADWGEGTSNPPFQEGQGAPATAGDATWLHRSFDTQIWSATGGDFVPTASASIVADAVGLYTLGPTVNMVADVQAWLDSPSTDFGWTLLGDESAFPTAKGFDSKDHPTAAVRPLLTVEFTAGAAGAGRVPEDGGLAGTPLTLEPAGGGDIRLLWADSCLPSDGDFEIYEGTLGDFASHVPLFCTTGGALEMTLTPAAGNAYYLVVPRNTTQEGSYGTDSDGLERPQGVGACLAQAIACP